MPTPHFPLIAVTLGDPGGIGAEVTVKALARLMKAKSCRRASFVLIGPPDIYEAWNQRLRAGLELNGIPLLDRRQLRPGKVYVLDLETALPPVSAVGWVPGQGRGTKAAVPARGPMPWAGGGGTKWSRPLTDIPGHIPIRVIPSSYQVGRISRNNAFLAYASLRIGAYLASCGLVEGLVTAPVHKEAMRFVDKGFVGHTEYLAEVSKTKHVAMMFDGGPVKVTLVTVHKPLREVSGVITRENVEIKIRLTDHFLRTFYKIKKPRIAVSALNPHGSEFGNEERNEIVPAIRAMWRKGVAAEGPFPGDTLFNEACRSKYDAAVFMYHDQGLAPLKAVAFDRAVNLTIGLPFIRTSPDHGTAFGLAGRNRADAGSMKAALRLAAKLCHYS